MVKETSVIRHLFLLSCPCLAYAQRNKTFLHAKYCCEIAGSQSITLCQVSLILPFLKNDTWGKGAPLIVQKSVKSY